MAIKINQTGKLLAAVVLLYPLFANYSMAEQSDSLLNFKFNHLTNKVQGIQNGNEDSYNFVQYDATWTYPWETKNMNFDLGLTLRHLSGFQNSTENQSNNHFQKVLPLLHASALFSIPLTGLSAGIEGSHLDSSTHQIFDYRAKVSYEWRKGFGLQGGWQHQQFNLDNSSHFGSDFEKNGPFLDFYLNF